MELNPFPAIQANYNATWVKQYTNSLAERIEAGGKTNFVVIRVMASLAFVPACATTLGQTGYIVKFIAFAPFKKGAQFVGHHENYSLEADARVAGEHVKRALKVAAYAVTSIILLPLGLIAPHVAIRLDSAFGATGDQAAPPTRPTRIERFGGWIKTAVIAKVTLGKQWVVAHPEIAAGLAVTAMATLVGGVYLWSSSTVPTPVPTPTPSQGVCPVVGVPAVASVSVPAASWKACSAVVATSAAMIFKLLRCFPSRAARVDRQEEVAVEQKIDAQSEFGAALVRLKKAVASVRDVVADLSGRAERDYPRIKAAYAGAEEAFLNAWQFYPEFSGPKVAAKGALERTESVLDSMSKRVYSVGTLAGVYPGDVADARKVLSSLGDPLEGLRDTATALDGILSNQKDAPADVLARRLSGTEVPQLDNPEILQAARRFFLSDVHNMSRDVDEFKGGGAAVVRADDSGDSSASEDEEEAEEGEPNRL